MFEESIQTLEEFQGEQLDWLGASGEDVVHDVVVLDRLDSLPGALHKIDSVLDGGDVVGRHVEILLSELVHDRVQLDDGGVDSVRHQGGGRRADSEATGPGVSFQLCDGELSVLT